MARIRSARAVTLVFTGALLLTLSAKLQVPFWPVPMTMQTWVVLVLGVGLWPATGRRNRAHLSSGRRRRIAGVRRRFGGPVYMMGPTAGSPASHNPEDYSS